MATTLTTVHTRKVPNVETISYPVLTFSDAMPRDDLRPINDGRHGHGKIGSWSFPRPGTSDGHKHKNPPPGGNATFDFRLTAPPDEVLPSSTRSDRSPIGPHMIGVALGSPSMLNPQEPLPPPRFNTSIFAQPQKEQTTPSRKASKWKKIGGLFKAKNALASGEKEENNARPDQQRNSTAQDKPAASDRKPKQRNEHTEEWPRIEIDPKATNNKTSSPQRSRNFSTSGRKSSKDTNGKEGLQLDVNIPDVQMERYSVMFSNVMDRNQRPSLLARRAKTLDSLRVPNAEPFLAAKGVPVPRRRATSPAHSNFTLFPTSQPPKAAKVLGTQNFSRGPKPLVRANTLPVESPSKAALEPPRLVSNNSTTSFESGVLPNLFSDRSHTPRSSKSSILNQDKPLPAIKSESQTQPKPQRLSPQAIRAAQSSHQDQRIAENLNAVKSQQTVKSRRNRPNLTIKTGASEPAPPLPAKDEKTKLSEPAPVNEPTEQLPETKCESTESPEKAAPTAPDPTPQPAQPEPIRVPLVTEPEEITAEEPSEPLPTIEVSTARSISVKKGKRQILVPIGARIDHLSPNERFVDRKALTPRIMDVRPGHKHAVSQELQIESL